MLHTGTSEQNKEQTPPKKGIGLVAESPTEMVCVLILMQQSLNDACVVVFSSAVVYNKLSLYPDHSLHEVIAIN